MYITFSACRNCSRSAIQAQEEGLDPCCESHAQPSPWLSSLDQSMRGIGEQRPITKSFPGCSLLPVEGNQSLLTYFLASCKSLSLVNLVRPLHWFWWDVWWIHIQLKPLKLILVIDAWLDKVFHQEIVFKRRFYSTHLQCKNMIYFFYSFLKRFSKLHIFSSYCTIK